MWAEDGTEPITTKLPQNKTTPWVPLPYLHNFIIMKQIESFIFKDTSFPLLIKAQRTSTVDNINSAKQALHEAIEIKCFYEGESTLLIGENTIQAKAGDVVVINPYEFHSTIDCGEGNNGRYHLIMISPDFFSGAQSVGFDIKKLICSGEVVFKNHYDGCTEMYDLLIKVAERSNFDDEYNRLEIFGLMAQFFAILLRNGVIRQNNPHAEKGILGYYSAIEPAIRMIRDKYAEAFTVDELATACNMSKYHFCRVFKALMGESAIQYLNSYRLKIANALIKSTGKTIGEIALLTGFEDASYFGKIYKKKFGKTPRKTITKQ